MDSDGIDIKISNGALDTIRYTIKINKLFKYQTADQIIVARKTKSIITATPAVQPGSRPLSGKFDVICVSELGQESRAKNIPWDSSYTYIGHKIQQYCHGMYNRIEAHPCDSKYNFPYKENGNCFKIRFKGYSGNPG